MATLSDRDFDKISVCVYAYVSHMFSQMCNEKYRGPKFKWEEFPEMMADSLAIQVVISYNVPKYKKKKYEEQARRDARIVAKTLVENAGFE